MVANIQETITVNILAIADKFQETIKHVNRTIRGLDENMNKINTNNKKLVNSNNKLVMAMLGTMFFGMALTRMFGGMLKPAADMLGIFDIWQITLSVFFLPVMKDLLPLFLKLVNYFLNLNPEMQKIIGYFVLIGLALGITLSILGQLGLGILSLIALWKLFGITGLLSTISITLAIAAIALMAFAIYKNWGGITHFFKQLWINVQIIFWKGVKGINDAIGWVQDKLSGIPIFGDYFARKTSERESASKDIQNTINALENLKVANEVAREYEIAQEKMKESTKGASNSITDSVKNISSNFNTGMTNIDKSTSNGMNMMNVSLNEGLSTANNNITSGIITMNTNWSTGLNSQYEDTIAHVKRTNDELAKIGQKSASGGGITLPSNLETGQSIREEFKIFEPLPQSQSIQVNQTNNFSTDSSGVEEKVITKIVDLFNQQSI
jgi:hypothetical protein